MRIYLELELMLALGVLLFAISLFVYGRVLGRLLKLIHRGGLWVFPVLGGVFLLIGVGVHLFCVSYYSTLLSHADPSDLFALIVGFLKMGAVESVAMLVAGLLSFLGGLIYYLWTSR